MHCDTGRTLSWWTPRRTCALLAFLLIFLLLVFCVALWLWWLFAASATRADSAAAPTGATKQRQAVAGAHRSNSKPLRRTPTQATHTPTPTTTPTLASNTLTLTTPTLASYTPSSTTSSPIACPSTPIQPLPPDLYTATSSPTKPSDAHTTTPTPIRQTDPKEDDAFREEAPRIGALTSADSGAAEVPSEAGAQLDYCTSSLMSCELPPADTRALQARGSSGDAPASTRRAHALLPVKMSNGTSGPRGPQGLKGPDGAPGLPGKPGITFFFVFTYVGSLICPFCIGYFCLKYETTLSRESIVNSFWRFVEGFAVSIDYTSSSD